MALWFHHLKFKKKKGGYDIMVVLNIREATMREWFISLWTLFFRSYIAGQISNESMKKEAKKMVKPKDTIKEK